MQQVIHALAFDHKYVLPVVVLDPPSILNELQNLRVRVARRHALTAATIPTTITTASSLVVPVPMDQPPSICASPSRSAAGGTTDHQVGGSWTLAPPYRLALVAFRWAA